MELTEPIIDEQVSPDKREQWAKKFAMEAIAPYFVDPSKCAIDSIGHCQYLMRNGNMCVLGKYLTKPGIWSAGATAYAVIKSLDQHELKEECRGILTVDQWGYLQRVHDYWASAQMDRGTSEMHKTTEENIQEMKTNILRLKLFTYEELIEYVEELKQADKPSE